MSGEGARDELLQVRSPLKVYVNVRIFFAVMQATFMLRYTWRIDGWARDKLKVL